MLTENIDYPRPGSYGRGSSPDLDFVYSDADLYDNEISELYSYTEHVEFQLNVKAFEDQMETYDLPPNWQKLTPDNRKSIIFKLLDQLDVAQRDIRMRSARCILYLAQGCWAEIQSDQEQEQHTKDNIKLLYKLGVFASFVELLNLEIRSSSVVQDASVPKPHEVSLSDSTDLRVILSVLYIITETIRTEYEAGQCQEYVDIYQAFQKEVNVPYDEELLTVKLLGMTTRFCSGTAPHFPIKKVLLLLWKVSLLSMGGMSSLRDLKNEYREKNNLDRLKEDTIEITRQMRSSSPPATAADILESQNQKEGRRIAFRRCTNEAFIEEQMDLESQTGMVPNSNNGEAEDDLNDYFRNCNVLPLPEQQENQQPFHNNSMLPWQPKVRQKDLEQFLEISRSKFIGYTLVNDLNTLAGLPEPIHEGYKILKNHMYTSLADVQIKLEENIARNPLTTNEGDIPQTSAEILYQAILPNLPQYMIALLKVLLAASPTSKSKTESINIMSDVLPKEIPLTEMASTKLEIDVNRHKEIIVKAVSGTLLLYLKHFKINHIYQFEFMSQHLVFANCIPLVLKFFNQNITDYVTSKNNIPLLDFPSCVLGDQTNLTSENLVFGDNASFSWRNMFSCINLLRILNKLIKWKHSRVMMLVVFKSAPILKKALKVRHAMMQLYVLKLLKMQTKYLGRQWRKTNMKTISAIYSKVRHRLNDDWAFGNDLESRPWDFQAEECTLRTCVDRFNNRRYPEATLKCQSAMNTQVQEAVNQGDDLQTDNINNNDNGLSLGGNLCMGNSGGDENDADHVRNCGCNGIWLDIKVELTDDFKANYEMWLDEEVSGTPIDWDILIKDFAQPIN